MKPSPFESASSLLPLFLRGIVNTMPEGEKDGVEEIRLRAQRPLTVTTQEGPRTLPISKPYIIQPRDIDAVLESASAGSVHTVLDQLRAGFVTVRGGHRLGVSGSVAMQNGAVKSIRHLSSLCLRIAKAMPHVSAPLWPGLTGSRGLHNVLILSPPGLGKTTLLRDLVRTLSDGGGAVPSHRVALADERGEVAALYLGVPQMDVGAHTDVLDGCPKAKALSWLVRALSPQVMALDEITAPEDIAAMETVRNCGVALLATCHGSGWDDIVSRPLYRELPHIFDRGVVISRQGQERRYQWIDMKTGGEISC